MELRTTVKLRFDLLLTVSKFVLIHKISVNHCQSTIHLISLPPSRVMLRHLLLGTRHLSHSSWSGQVQGMAQGPDSTIRVNGGWWRVCQARTVLPHCLVTSQSCPGQGRRTIFNDMLSILYISQQEIPC